MNRLSLLPLSTAALLALAASAMILSPNKLLSGTARQSITQRVMDVPTVKVSPNQADLTDDRVSQSSRVVNLPAVKVTPDASDLAYYQATRGAERVITLATVSVRPAAEDLANYLSSKQRQVADQEAGVVRRGAQYLRERINQGALTLERISR